MQVASDATKEKRMKTYYTVGLSMIVGIGIGAVAVQSCTLKPSPQCIP